MTCNDEPSSSISTECLISPRREKGEPEISKTAILCPNPADILRFARLSKPHSTKDFFLYNSRFWRVSGELNDFYICGPAVGAPMAVLTLEKLAALGCKKIIVIGSCGAISKKLAIGDVFLPIDGISEEGTSAHYPLDTTPSASIDLCKDLEKLLQLKKIESKVGKIWTTDAPFRETRQKVAQYMISGVEAVDMEFTALIKVAAFRGVKLGAAMVVSDILHSEKWISGFTSKIFKQKCNAVCEAVFERCLVGEL